MNLRNNLNRPYTDNLTDNMLMKYDVSIKSSLYSIIRKSLLKSLSNADKIYDKIVTILHHTCHSQFIGRDNIIKSDTQN